MANNHRIINSEVINMLVDFTYNEIFIYLFNITNNSKIMIIFIFHIVFKCAPFVNQQLISQNFIELQPSSDGRKDFQWRRRQIFINNFVLQIKYFLFLN